MNNSPLPLTRARAPSAASLKPRRASPLAPKWGDIRDPYEYSLVGSWPPLSPLPLTTATRQTPSLDQSSYWFLPLPPAARWKAPLRTCLRSPCSPVVPTPALISFPVHHCYSEPSVFIQIPGSIFPTPPPRRKQMSQNLSGPPPPPLHPRPTPHLSITVLSSHHLSLSRWGPPALSEPRPLGSRFQPLSFCQEPGPFMGPCPIPHSRP